MEIRSNAFSSTEGKVAILQHTADDVLLVMFQQVQNSVQQRDSNSALCVV